MTVMFRDRSAATPIQPPSVGKRAGAPGTTRMARIGLGLILALTVTACAAGPELDFVRQFSKTISDSKSAFTALAEDYYGSCLRYEIWLFPGPERTTPESACKDDRAASDQWTAANNVLLGYVAAMGRLAGAGQKATYGVDDFVTAMGTLQTIGPTRLFSKDDLDKAKGYQPLLIGVLDAIYAQQRLDAIRQFAKQADPAVTFLIDRLTHAAAEYGRHLTSERNEVNTFFSPLAQGANTTPAERLRTLQPRAAWVEALKSLDDRETAKNAYVDALKAIKDAQARLLNAKSAAQSSRLPEDLVLSLRAFRTQVALLDNALKH